MPPALIIGGAIAAVGIGTAVYGQVKTAKAQKKMVKQQNKANAAQRAQDNMKAARERREAIRSARLASGQVTQDAANQGVSGSSAALGGLGSISQQLNQGLSFLDGMNTLADQASVALGKANVFGAQAEKWQGVSNLGMQVFSAGASVAGGTFGGLGKAGG